MSSSSSLRLLEQARSGDSESLGLLLKNYFRYLNSLSEGQIDPRVRQRVSPSDIVQETLLEAHRDFKSFVGTSLEEFTGWLRKILFNNLSTAIESHLLTAKRDIRRQRSLNQQNNDNSRIFGDMEQLFNASATSPSAPLNSDESVKELMMAIGRLPAAYRQVIQLRHFEGMTFAEIAVRLDRTSGATRMLWMRAVEKLKNEMKDDSGSAS